MLEQHMACGGEMLEQHLASMSTSRKARETRPEVQGSEASALTRSGQSSTTACSSLTRSPSRSVREGRRSEPRADCHRGWEFGEAVTVALHLKIHERDFFCDQSLLGGGGGRGGGFQQSYGGGIGSTD
jgi:hypothetical protein